MRKIESVVGPYFAGRVPFWSRRPTGRTRRRSSCPIPRVALPPHRRQLAAEARAAREGRRPHREVRRVRSAPSTAAAARADGERRRRGRRRRRRRAAASTGRGARAPRRAPQL